MRVRRAMKETRKSAHRRVSILTCRVVSVQLQLRSVGQLQVRHFHQDVVYHLPGERHGVLSGDGLLHVPVKRLSLLRHAFGVRFPVVLFHEEIAQVIVVRALLVGRTKMMMRRRKWRRRGRK